MKVLVVDDDESFVDFIFHILQSRYEIVTARNGETAIKAFRRENPDLIVTDLVMPRLDGFMLIAEIRRNAKVPIVVISGGSQAGQSATFVTDIGADAFLPKPFKPEDLINTVATLLAAHQSSPLKTAG